ncbi:MAG: class I SAM-dependent methyltransferase, partial [Gemmatimonadetes bacterium]|nr:class I SAM-dependent methyltransferase [Gemmatimonadota bacterium]
GLDIGTGAGGNLELLEPYGRFIGSEVTPELWTGGKERPARPVLLASGDALPLADGSLGICTFFDVLEHIEDEDAFLTEVHRVLGREGYLFLSVPAYMFLWGDHDVSLHHFRRYVKSTLTEALTRNGFRVTRMTYGFAATLPGVAAYRLLSRLRPGNGAPQASYVKTPAPLNGLLVKTLEWEAKWLAKADLPFGVSLLALARKES